MSLSARIIILNYNGRELLEKCLASIVKTAETSQHHCKVTVLDNQSQDDSRRYVEENFPGVSYVESPENRVLCSYNACVADASEEVVILLNNDILVDEGFVDPMLDMLEADQDVCFVASQSRTYDSDVYEGSRSKLEMRWGLVWGSSRFAGYESQINKSGITMQCGFGAFRRRYFLELEGYDDMYLPGTVEDADLCFRAYRKGWKGMYCPQSVVRHIGQATFKKTFGTKGLRRLNHRNQYLFVWKNVDSRTLLAKHVLCLPLRLVRYVLKGEWECLLGFKDALGRLPQALKRRKLRPAYVRSDRDVFKISQEMP